LSTIAGLKNGGLHLDEVSHLDLIVRWGCARRLSGFLPVQSDGLAHYKRNIRPGSISWQMLRKKAAIKSGFAVIVPAETNHHIINTGSVPMKLYAIYSPPNHRDGIVPHTLADAEKDNEQFNGKAME
jgi:hypothetical protein